MRVDLWNSNARAWYILETEYGYNLCENLYLNVVHPDLAKPRLIKTPYMQDEMLLIAEDQIQHGKAVAFASRGPTAQFNLPNVAV